MSSRREVLVGLVPALCAVGILALLDLVAGVSVLDPVVFYGFAGFLGLSIFVFRRSNRTRAVSSALVILIAPLISAIEWTNEKRFLRVLVGLKPGMSEEDVRHAMAGFAEGTGWPANPFEGGQQDSAKEFRIQGAIVFRPSAEPGDSNWGIVRFGPDRRVTSVEFSAD
jgi:hypothetical protein